MFLFIRTPRHDSSKLFDSSHWLISAQMEGLSGTNATKANGDHIDILVTRLQHPPSHERGHR